MACAFSFANGWAQNNVGGASFFHQKNRKHRVANSAQWRTVQNTMQRLDSVHSFVNDPVNGMATLSYKEGYWYDQSNRCVGYFSLEWNTVSQTMDSSYKEMYAFDANDRIVEITTYMSDGTTLYQDTKISNTYDALGNLTQTLEEAWDFTSNGWMNNVLTSSTYDTNGGLTQEVHSLWDVGLQQWIYNFRITNTYSNGSITFSLNEFFDVAQNAWVGNTQTTYLYDGSGLLLSEESQYFDAAVTLSWIPGTLIEYSYNANGQKDVVTSSYYDVAMGTYTPNSLTNYVYDAEGNMVQEINLDTMDPFNPYYRQNFTFDNTYTFSDLILPNFLVEEVPDYFTHKLDQLSIDMWDGTEWLNENSAMLYYSAQSVVGVNEMEEKTPVLLYPNPVRNQMMIQFKGSNQIALLYNASGKCLSKQTILGNTVVEIGHLPAGMYAWVINGQAYSFIKE